MPGPSSQKTDGLADATPPGSIRASVCTSLRSCTPHASRYRPMLELARRVGRRPLGPASAEALMGAVRHAARWWPGRAACMETSLGAVLAAALLGRRLDWCLGARFAPPPVEYHAWAELPDHGPVGEYTLGGWHHHTALTI
ncbi:lasso peptide biosynthesis B2 protein [Streptomyces cinereoruber]|uniref:lasso peptide biosynthesis B2 protein n=1 Tax=Streptomyces cinereoruber TaxID=67260 RepID=UPI0036431A1E